MIVKNILSNNDYINLYDLVSSVHFPWYYQPNIAFRTLNESVQDPHVFPSHGFTHVVWDCDQGKVSDVLQLVAPIVEGFQKQLNVKINNFLRIKINLQTPIVGYTNNHYNGPHIDRFDPHKTIIYYLNDSDGDTVIFDKKYDPANKLTWDLTNLSVKEKVTPIANSLYFLDDGFTYHSGSNPINSSRRITININYN